MYPAGGKYQLFRRTSLPIKVSTYVQAQRPIFAHTPADSTLACVVTKYKLGAVCMAGIENDIAGDVPSSSTPYRGKILREPQAT